MNTHIFSCLCRITGLVGSLMFSGVLWAQEYKEVKRFSVESVRQAVAVDTQFFYSIDNSRIARYTPDGNLQQVWEESEPKRIKHMNSGIIVGDKLYCAHSNYPEVPMASSIEVFDKYSLTHIESISLGIGIGSCTWILPKTNGWYVFFAHYDRNGGEPGRGVEWSQLVEFDTEWRRMKAWTLPDSLIAEIKPYSLSGAIMKDGMFYCTGHDEKKCYLLAIPDRGMQLEWKGSVSIPFAGQGIDMDAEGHLWGIDRKGKYILKSALSD